MRKVRKGGGTKVTDLNRLFLGFLGLDEPWYVESIEWDPVEGRVDLHVSFRAGTKFPCPECGGSHPVHDCLERTWRHLNLFQHKTYLHARVPRVECPEHGVHQIAVPWGEERSGFTLLFEAFVMELAHLLPVKEISRILGENDTRLWRVIRRVVDRFLAAQDLSGLRKVGVDETSYRRGHKYITAFVDLDTGHAVWVTEGKGKATLAEFTAYLTSRGVDPSVVTDFSLDMSEAFIQGIRENFPNARVTFDKFHVVKMMNEAVDQVRREERQSTEELAGSRFLWLHNPEDLSAKQKEALAILLASGNTRKTQRAYALRLLLQEFYEKTPRWGAVWLKRWYWRGSHSRLEPVKKLARTIKSHWDGVLNHVRTGIDNGILEGRNSLFKATAAKARGYRTSAYAATAYLLANAKVQLQLPGLQEATHTG
jgi:transposase